MAQADPLSGGVTVITGAASGMGAAAAELMSGAGRRLLLCDLNCERLAAAAAGLRDRGPVDTLAGDIADPAFPDQLVEALGGRPIGAFIHCAGLSPTMAEPARVLQVNLAATLRLVEAVRPRMAEGGAAVLFASMAAHQVGTMLDEPLAKVTTPEAVASLEPMAQNSGAAYAISKRGVQLLAQRQARAFGDRGARIVSLSPGCIDTPMGRQEKAEQPVMQALVANSALRREARPEEVAQVAAFLCSPAASFITGTDILVDGGAVAGMASAQG